MKYKQWALLKLHWFRPFVLSRSVMHFLLARNCIGDIAVMVMKNTCFKWEIQGYCEDNYNRGATII